MLLIIDFVANFFVLNFIAGNFFNLWGGYMIGPMLGSLLYEYGGFLATFLSAGLVGLVLSVLLIVVIPTGKYDTSDDENNNDEDKRQISTLGLTDIFKSIKILFPFVDNMICFVGTGI